MGKWEKIANYTFRLKVFGGWMVVSSGTANGENETSYSESAIFVPDPYYIWELDEDPT